MFTNKLIEGIERMSYRDQLSALIKVHAGSITDEQLKQLYFYDKVGNIYQFESYEDERISPIINDLVSCSWIKAEDFAKSFIKKSGEPRGPKEETSTASPNKETPTGTSEKKPFTPIESSDKATE